MLKEMETKKMHDLREEFKKRSKKRTSNTR